MAMYNSFVALDLETTGLDPVTDEVVEIGAVRVEKGTLTEEFSQLVKPRSPIPFNITQLTGLTTEDLSQQPAIEEVFPRLTSFLGSSPIVCHNAPFDLSFLKDLAPRNGVRDTQELARIVVPWAKNHRLDSLLSLFGVQAEKRHRALEDARGVARLFLKLLSFVEGMDPRLLKLICDLTEPTEWAFKDLFKEALKGSFTGTLERRSPMDLGSTPRPNVVGKRGGEVRDTGEVSSYFGPRGPLSSRLEGYEYRDEQLEMAEDVALAFEEDGLLVCEAGTGIGKSLAYLVPALLFSVSEGEKVIVSTNTKNLQDQLFYKDLPLLLDCFDFNFQAVLLKGRANYLCLRRWFEITANPDLHLTLEERIAILPLLLWVEKTEAGDLSENTGFYQEENSPLWRKLRCEPNGCLAGECRLHEMCFLTRVRSQAQDANLVVVNHSLVLSDLIAQNKVLGPYRRLIVDEAHNLEKVATEHLGLSVNLWTVKGALDLLYSPPPLAKGLIPALRRRALRAKQGDLNGDMLVAELDRLKGLVSDGRTTAIGFFAKLAELGASPYGKLRYRSDDRILRELSEETEALLSSLGEICQSLSQVEACLSGLGALRMRGYKEAKADLEGRLEELRGVLAQLKTLTSAEREDLCYWVSVSRSDYSMSQYDSCLAELHGAPVEVGPVLASSLYPTLSSALFTSATLRAGSSFDYFLQRTGLNLVRRGLVRERAFGSPFDYVSQVLALLPAYLPSPQKEEFPHAMVQLLEQVVLGTRRGALVLLTSHRLLNQLYHELKGEFERRKVSLLAQGLTGSRTRLIEQKREERSSALLGTDSFWEGVDVPGEALEILVISKLPFPVPNEPIVEARSEAIGARGGNPFTELMVPQTVIRFRQGFGRLIRSKKDRGVVMILDTRIVERDYGKVFLSSLPVQPEICQSLEEVERRVRGWWEDNG